MSETRGDQMRSDETRDSETRGGEARTSHASASGGAVSRRTFLRVTLPAIGATVLAASGFVAFEDWFGFGSYLDWQWRGLRNHASAYRYAFLPAEDRLKRHFSDLTIDEDGLRRFVRDYEKYVGRIKWYSVTSNRVLFSKFLLSSDYYRNGADAKRPVKYVAFYDPYVSPCWNPFARA